MRADFGKRASSLRSIMASSGLKAALVSSRSDIFYYTGRMLMKDDPAFLLLPTKGRSTLFVSSLSNDVKASSSLSVKDLKNLKPSLSRFGKIGFDERSLTVHSYQKLRKSSQSWKPLHDGMKKPMAIKDLSELDLMDKAININLKCFSAHMLDGKNEAEAVHEIERRIRDHGAEPSFDPIVATGANSGYIHHTPSDRRISQGLTIVDCGAMYGGYCSDLTRTFSVSGKMWEKKLWSDIESIQGELIDLIKPGIRFSSVQKRYETLMKKRGYKVAHLFGHGVGLNVHEGPSGDDVLQPGMVLTVEPGAYFEKRGGCRIEDMVLVTRSGCKVLSR